MKISVVNRLLRIHPIQQVRIQVVQLVPDISSAYNVMMNAIFSALKLNVLVDAVVLSKIGSSFFQVDYLLTRMCFITLSVHFPTASLPPFEGKLSTPSPTDRCQCVRHCGPTRASTTDVHALFAKREHEVVAADDAFPGRLPRRVDIAMIGVSQKSVDFRATCSCHQRHVEFAIMCSVCLAVTCDVEGEGDTCGTCGTARAKRTRK